MKLLLDQGLPRSTPAWLSQAGIDAIHVAEIGLATATNANILQKAKTQGRVVVTLDADFHTLLALTQATSPSVIRIRLEKLRAQALSQL
jgi:predicted nuclease of predicted toxin-antitoxin system